MYKIFLRENFLSVLSWWPHCSQCFLNVCHRGKRVCHSRDVPPWHTKNVFTFHSRSRVTVKQCAWNLHQSCMTSRSIDKKKKNEPEPIIRTGVTVPNVQVCHGGSLWPIHFLRHVKTFNWRVALESQMRRSSIIF